MGSKVNAQLRHNTYRAPRKENILNVIETNAFAAT
jgi:hypothetical protein